MSPGNKSLNSTSNQNLGYSPIPQISMEKNLRSQVQWLNHFAFSFQVKSFPSDLIELNGQ